METEFLLYLFVNCTLRKIGKNYKFKSIDDAIKRADELQNKVGVTPASRPYKNSQFVIVEHNGSFEHKIVKVIN